MDIREKCAGIDLDVLFPSSLLQPQDRYDVRIYLLGTNTSGFPTSIMTRWTMALVTQTCSMLVAMMLLWPIFTLLSPNLSKLCPKHRLLRLLAPKLCTLQSRIRRTLSFTGGL